MAELAHDELMAAAPPQPAARLAPRQWQSTAELAVVIPVLNECDNVALMVERLTRALADIRWEAIFVDDDSPDGTADVVRALARLQGNVRCVQRLGRRGLASACIEGILSSAAPYIAVMDGDLQHDEALLPQMLAQIKAERLDVVVASRYIEAGSVGEWQRVAGEVFVDRKCAAAGRRDADESGHRAVEPRDEVDVVSVERVVQAAGAVD